MKSLVRHFAVAIFCAATLGAPVVAQTVTIDYDHSVDFLKFKTYTWGKIHATNPDVESRLTLAANRDMKGRYMTEVAKDSDVTLAAVVATQDKQEVSTFYDSLGDFPWQRTWGSSGFLDSQATLSDVPLYTLVLDMYDTKSHKLLWRGTITVPAADATSKEADQKFDKAITQLIGKYPPKFKK
ncbi:MAG TPA: DUF4136 domain-containing protein [Acidobacteriaceae bacterium]|jgi:hypothetical protein